MPKPMPKPKFMTLGKSGKVVHLVRTEAWDRKNSECQQVRKFLVAGKIDYKHKGISPEAALAIGMLCDDCGSKKEAKALTKDADRAARKDKANATLDKAKGKDRPTKKVKDDKPKPEPKQSITKSGPRSIASGKDKSASMNKAEQLAEFGKQHGWRSTLEGPDDMGRVTVVAVKDDMTIRAPFIDGKFDEVQWGSITVGSWSGRLRAAHYTRRQMSGDNPPYPRPGEGRTGPRVGRKAAEPDPPADESPEDARRRVPFLLDDDDSVILDSLLGMRIRWRNKTSGLVETAQIPAEVGKGKRAKVEIKHHPKSGKPMVSFFEVAEVTVVEGKPQEVYGPERTVALDRILRVIAA